MLKLQVVFFLAAALNCSFAALSDYLEEDKLLDTAVKDHSIMGIGETLEHIIKNFEVYFVNDVPVNPELQLDVWEDGLLDLRVELGMTLNYIRSYEFRKILSEANKTCPQFKWVEMLFKGLETEIEDILEDVNKNLKLN